MRPCCVIPSRNHYLAVASVVQHARACGLPVFLIDDASDEPASSALAALHAPDQGVQVTRLEIRGGKGGAVISGFRLASAAGFTHAVQLDADGQHDLNRLPALLAQAAAWPDAVVSGHARYNSTVSRGRRWGRYFTHMWVWIETLSVTITDSMCGFRVYPLQPVMQLLAAEPVGRFMDFDIEIMVRLSWRGVPVVMMPVDVIYPPDNTSNFDLLRDNWQITKMHTRLFFTMLWRLPGILRQRVRLGSARA